MGKFRNWKVTHEKRELNNGIVVYRVVAARDLPNGVTKGTIGGWVEPAPLMDNKFSEGWIGDDAIVLADSVLIGNAVVCGNALVSGQVFVCGDCVIDGNTVVSGHVSLQEGVTVTGNARVIIPEGKLKGGVHISEDAIVTGNTTLQGNIRINGNAILNDVVISKGDYTFGKDTILVNVKL